MNMVGGFLIKINKGVEGIFLQIFKTCRAPSNISFYGGFKRVGLEYKTKPILLSQSTGTIEQSVQQTTRKVD